MEILGFEPETIKLKSTDPEAFIASLERRIIVNPKILPKIKEWDPSLFLVSFKFEVGQTKQELREIAEASMRGANGDLVVANDKVEMKKAGTHIARLYWNDEIYPPGPSMEVRGKHAIALKVADIVTNLADKRSPLRSPAIMGNGLNQFGY